MALRYRACVILVCTSSNGEYREQLSANLLILHQYTIAETPTMPDLTTQDKPIKGEAVPGAQNLPTPQTDGSTPSEDLELEKQDLDDDKAILGTGNDLPTPETTTPGAATEISNSSKKTEAIKSDLERMSRACIEAFNDRDFEYANTQDRRDFHSSVMPTFGANFETFPNKTMNWEETRDTWKKFVAWESNAKFEIILMSTDVHSNGNATVYAEVMMSGVKSLNFSRFIFMKWKIVGGKWMYYSCTTMGGASNRGLVG